MTNTRLSILILFIALSVAVIISLSSVEAIATTLYVSTGGSDGGNGSSSLPFRTVQRAADVVKPGDTIIVRDGIYTGGKEYVAIFRRGGTDTAWVTFRSENKWGAKIDGRNYTTGVLFVADANYLRFENFEFQHAKSINMRINSVHHDIYWYGNKVHDTSRYMIPCNSSVLTVGNCGGFAGSNSDYNLTWDSNIFYDVGRLYGGCPNYDKNHDHGLYLYGNHITIINNMFYNFEAGWPIVLAPGSNNITIRNNTFSGPNPRELGHILFWGEQQNVLIENNIFYQPREAPLRNSYCSGDSNIVAKNNITTTSEMVKGRKSCISVIGNLVDTVPGFVDAKNHDFRLRNDSPALKTGAGRRALPDEERAEISKRRLPQQYDR
jgi:hypothetical protein